MWLEDYFHSLAGLRVCSVLGTGIWDVPSVVAPERVQLRHALSLPDTPTGMSVVLSLSS